MMDVLRDPGIASVRCFGFFKYPKIYCYKKQNDVFRIRAFQEELSDCDRFPTKAKAAVRLVKKKKKFKNKQSRPWRCEKEVRRGERNDEIQVQNKQSSGTRLVCVAMLKGLLLCL